VLLNAAPAAILMSGALRSVEWQALTGYAELLQQHPNASPWLEYGGPLAERQADDGRTVIATAFDMRECRACANLATFGAELTFDPSGFIAAVDVLPPGPPRIS
jgi:hypothetical protein